METTNKLAVAGFIAGLTIFGTASSLAAQTCQEMQGELHLISVKGQIGGMVSDNFGMEYELIRDNRIRLNEKAMVVCSDSQFCVDEKGIKTTFNFHPWTKISSGSMTAVVNCLDSL